VKEIEFSSSNWPVLRLYAGHSPSFCSCRTHHSRERSPPFVDIEHRQHGERSIGVLRQAAIANLGKAPETLEGEKGMLDLGTYAGFSPVGGFIGLRQRTVSVSAFVGEVFGLRRDGLESLALCLASVGAVTVEAGFFAMQQIRGLCRINEMRPDIAYDVSLFMPRFVRCCR
jgi:hypothetical protein